MRSLNLVTLALLTSGVAAQLPTGILGFNSGATLDNRNAKQQSDFEGEFNAAQKLHGSPGLFKSVRLYTMIQSGTTADPISAFPAAIATNTTMLLGIWCSGTDNIDNELKAMKSAIEKHGQRFADLVIGISVGSEDLYRTSESGIANKAGVGQGPDQIISFINSVRDAVKGTSLANKPIGHVDSWSAWANTTNKAVVDAVDFLGTDLYPYYEKDKGNTFDNSTNVFDYIYSQALSAVGGNSTGNNGTKPVWVTETGWPDSGPTFGQAEASRGNAEKYWQNIGCGKLFGRTNVWWYNIRDSNPDNKEKFAITDNLSAGSPHFNLTCAANSGAPAAINLQSAAPRTLIWQATALVVAVVTLVNLW